MNATQFMFVYLVSRYLHLVCATLLVGGTLFYEMVVPSAIEELKQEQQLLVFARARLVFKWIVWISVVTLFLSGIVTTRLNWAEYTADWSNTTLPPTVFPVHHYASEMPRAGLPGMWWAAHAASGVVALMIALGLMIGNVPPAQPIRWMRINLVILLLVMFLATASRQARDELEGYRHPAGPPPPPSASEQ